MPSFSPLHYASGRSRLLLRRRRCSSTCDRTLVSSNSTYPATSATAIGKDVRNGSWSVCYTPGEPPMIKVHKIVDLSSSPDRGAMWYLEVIEAYKLFYQPLVEEFT